MAYENERFTPKEKRERNDIALKSTSESNDLSDDDALAMLTNNFKRFIRKSRESKDYKHEREHKDKSPFTIKSLSKEQVCYECNKPGHIKPNCPTLKSKETAHQASWTDSESESDQEDCLMAWESTSEVTLFNSKFNSLEEAFLDLVEKYKSEKQLTKSLRIECMHRSNENELETYKQNCMKLEESNSKLLRKIENQESKIGTLKEQNLALVNKMKLTT